MLENLSLETIGALIALIYAIGSTVVNVIQKSKNKNLSGALETASAGWTSIKSKYQSFLALMTPSVPQTDDQTAVANDPEVKQTYAMSNETFSKMCEYLAAKGACFRKTDLRAVVLQADAAAAVEYAIIMCNKSGDPDTSCSHVLVSYGIPMYWSYDELISIALKQHVCGEPYSVPCYYQMSETTKSSILSSIGNRPACIAAALTKIADAEAQQLEEYAIVCDNRYWIIKKGKLDGTYAGADEVTQPSA